MYSIKVYTYPKAGVLDPQGAAIEKTLSELGFEKVKGVQTGKFFELKVDACCRAEAEMTAKELCKEILVNPVTEDFKIEIMED